MNNVNRGIILHQIALTQHQLEVAQLMRRADLIARHTARLSELRARLAR